MGIAKKYQSKINYKLSKINNQAPIIKLQTLLHFDHSSLHDTLHISTLTGTVAHHDQQDLQLLGY